jgi:hypothetical protein
MNDEMLKADQALMLTEDKFALKLAHSLEIADLDDNLQYYKKM